MVTQSLNAQVALDDSTDVLYVRLPDVTLSTSREAPSDAYLIFNEDQAGRIVGVQVLYATDLVEHWDTHPDRSLLPGEIASAIDRWVASRH